MSLKRTQIINVALSVLSVKLKSHARLYHNYFQGRHLPVVSVILSRISLKFSDIKLREENLNLHYFFQYTVSALCITIISLIQNLPLLGRWPNDL